MLCVCCFYGLFSFKSETIEYGTLRRDYKSSHLDDSLVIKRIIAGEKDLFEILLRRYNQTLYRVIRAYLKDEDELQDAMQNAYLKVFDQLSQFKEYSSFSTWLIRIGINEALPFLNDIKRGKVIYLNTIQDISAEFVKKRPKATES